MPKRDDGRLTPPEQIGAALATKMRTADVAAIDEAALFEVEATLTKLSDVVAATYFTSRERSEASWESLS
jgi:hypothetical protein